MPRPTEAHLIIGCGQHQYICMYTCIHLYMCMYMEKHMYMYVSVNMRIHIYNYICIYVLTYVYDLSIYLRTHACMSNVDVSAMDDGSR